MNPDIRINIGKLKLKNPVMVASGTFGYAKEFKDFMDLKKLGAIVTKTITIESRAGNLPPRTCEAPAGMLNSIGLENPGLEVFIREKIPLLKKIGVPVIVSIASESDPAEFLVLAKRLDKIKEVSAIELNISCPNIQHIAHSAERRADSKNKDLKLNVKHHPLISQDSTATYALVEAVRKVTGKTIITKLSPNVADIAEIAFTAEKAGSDAVSLINTLTGMSIDVEKRVSKIAAITAGLSGPAVRPVAVRMVWEVYNKIKIPIIGMGGIIDTASALEFFIAGAAAISVGTANFINPRVSIEILDGLRSYLVHKGIKSIKDISGSLKV